MQPFVPGMVWKWSRCLPIHRPGPREVQKLFLEVHALGMSVLISEHLESPDEDHRE